MRVGQTTNLYFTVQFNTTFATRVGIIYYGCGQGYVMSPTQRSPNSRGYKEAMATRNLSFETILEEKPTLDELCGHIHIGSKW